MSIVEVIKTENNNTKIPQILKTKCKEVENIDDSVKEVIKNLKDTLKNHIPPGAGLSAPQIGVDLRICLVKKFRMVGQQEKITDHILINPTITNYSTPTDIRWEGCLSIPDTYGKVQRSKQLSVIAQDENGEKIKIKASGYFARVIQHEVDHLNGVLFTDKVIGQTATENELDQIFETSENSN